MKKLILILVLLIAGFLSAQSDGIMQNGGTIWTDSLGYTTASETSDSVWILDTRYHDWYKFTMEGNANAQADSIVIQSGVVRYTAAGVETDTVWGNWCALKDSAWGDQNVMVNNTVGMNYLLFSPVNRLMKISLLNYRLAIPTRNCVLTIEAVGRIR